MQIRALRTGLLISFLAGCRASSAPATDASSLTAAEPATLQQIDRVSLLAWKETLGPRYPLTVSRADSVAMVLDLFKTSASPWSVLTVMPGVPMLAAFYRGGEVESRRGFIETSHGMGGLLVVQEHETTYARTASAADIARFLSFFGVGVVVIPN